MSSLVKISEIIDIRDGTHDSPKYVSSGYPLITSKNLVNGKIILENVNYISEADYININKRSKVEKGDILYSMIGSIGNIAKVGEDPQFAIKNVALFKKSERIYDGYLFHLLNSNVVNKQIDIESKGGTQKFVSLGILRKLKIPLPPLPEQKRIADLLDAADILRQKDKALLKKYDQLAQSLFLEMFGDPVKNEKGWESKDLKSLSSKITSGNTPKGGSDVYVDSGITFFRSQNVWKNRIVYDDVAFIDDEIHGKMKNTSLKKGDILITKTGRFNTENSSLGRAAMYLGDDDKANINGHVYLIRLINDVVKEFVLFILTSDQFKDHIRRVCVGGIDKRQLNKDHIEMFPIILPPISLQTQFAEKVKLIEKQKELAKKNLEKSEALFGALMGEVFR